MAWPGRNRSSMGDGQFLYHWKPQYFSVANSMLPCLVQNIISDSTVSKLTTAKNSGSKPRPIKISILGGHIEVSKSYINLRGRALLQRHRPQSLEGAHCLSYTRSLGVVMSLWRMSHFCHSFIPGPGCPMETCGPISLCKQEILLPNNLRWYESSI